MRTLLPLRHAAVPLGVNWSIAIAVVIVVVLSAGIRLGFYFWWRGKFGGRPIRRHKVDGLNPEHRVIDWDEPRPKP